MVKRRSKEDIILKLLETCINGATKTDIVYQGSLNFRTVKPYMNLLKKKSLIEPFQEHPVKYRTTPKGLEVIEALRKLNSMMEEMPDQLGSPP